jgi:hypothetical protein
MDKLLDKRIHNQIRNWVLIGTASTILLVITSLNTYYNTSFRIINEAFLLVQLVILLISIIYFMKVQKWKKELKLEEKYAVQEQVVVEE